MTTLCTRPGCGAPAYVGLSAVKCTNKACPHFDQSELDDLESRKTLAPKDTGHRGQPAVVNAPALGSIRHDSTGVWYMGLDGRWYRLGPAALPALPTTAPGGKVLAVRCPVCSGHGQHDTYCPAYAAVRSPTGRTVAACPLTFKPITSCSCIKCAVARLTP